MQDINFNYIRKFFKIFQMAAQFSQSAQEEIRYRLVQLPKDNDPYIYIQIINSRAISKLLPQEIMRDNMLMHFSRADIALITHLGTKNEVQQFVAKEKPAFYKILQRLFVKEKTAFVLEKEDHEIATHSAEELYQNEALAEKLTGKDGMEVGYSVAEAHYQKILKLKIK
jgi:hypothetical protein